MRHWYKFLYAQTVDLFIPKKENISVIFLIFEFLFNFALSRQFNSIKF